MGEATQERALDGDEPQDPAAHLRVGLVLAHGGLYGDLAQPADRVGLPQRQRHHDRSVLVAPRLPRLLVVERDGHQRAQHQPIDRFATACQQFAQAAGHRG
jgi:hypothetical protein